VAPQCSSAPNIPTLSVSWDEKGVTFVGKKSEGGENPTNLLWNYALYDVANNKWGEWAGWVTVGPNEVITKQFLPQSGKSRIAFSVYSTNQCGASAQARERSENTGVPLAVLQKDTIKDFSGLIRPAYGDSPRRISEHIFSANGIPLTYESLTQEICKLNSDSLTVIKPGICRISTKGSTQLNIAAADTLETAIVIQKGVERISAKDISPLGVDESRAMSISSSGNPEFRVEVLTSTGTCEVVNNVVKAKKVGPCAINIVSSESEFFGSAQYSFVLQVVKSANNIIGSLPNQIVATNQVRLEISPLKLTALRVISLTPNICTVEGLILSPLSSGVCEIKSTAEENEKYLSSEQVFQTTIYKQSQKLVLADKSFVATTRKGEFAPPVSLSSGLTPLIRSLSPRTCTSDRAGKVTPKSAGECRLLISHPGSSIYEPASEVSLVGFIVNDGFTITCSKGKVSKKVSGANPKCPPGYKKN
jgi:hypothetical protein